jgi:hypothetical protein
MHCDDARRKGNPEIRVYFAQQLQITESSRAGIAPQLAVRGKSVHVNFRSACWPSGRRCMNCVGARQKPSSRTRHTACCASMHD